MPVLTKDNILETLKDMQITFAKEGFIIKALFGSYSRNEANKNSDIDVLVEATPQFANKYGFQSIHRIKEIQTQMSKTFGVSVDLADSSGMGATGKKFILDRAIYV